MLKNTNFNFSRKISRRTMLRGVGVSMALPWLTAMQPAFAARAKDETPRRFVAITLGLGLHSPNLNPQKAGRDYQESLYLKSIKDLRDKFTVISGSSHPGVTGGHRAEASLLTANATGGSEGTGNTISIDQYLARYRGDQTRFRSMVLASSSNNSPSYTENGSMIPAENSPSRLFTKMFVDDSPAERKHQAQRVREGRSIMDIVGEDAKLLKRQVGVEDNRRLDDYFTSVRDLEKRMAESEAWANRPKPKVDAKKPVDIRNGNDFVGRQRLMCDMIRLALETDSTRFVSYHLGGAGGVIPLDGVDEGYHSLSHHGLDEDKLEQLAIVESAIISAWGDFLRSLNKADDSGENLLDQTTVLLTSNLGNASNHNNQNMPVLLAGGGFNHGQHLSFDQNKNYPLPNLFVSLLQRFGLEKDKFATGTGTMKGLEFKN